MSQSTAERQDKEGEVPKCMTCNGTGLAFIGFSGKEEDGNAPEYERCPECGYWTPCGYCEAPNDCRTSGCWRKQ